MDTELRVWVCAFTLRAIMDSASASFPAMPRISLPLQAFSFSLTTAKASVHDLLSKLPSAFYNADKGNIKDQKKQM